MVQGCVYTAQCGGVCKEDAVAESEFLLVSLLLWKWVYTDYSPTSMLAGAKCCTSSASFCPFLVSGWRLCCFLLLLCCDMGRSHKFMDQVSAWPRSEWPSGFHTERFWCCLGQLVVLLISIGTSGPVPFICLPMVSVCLTGLWCLYLYSILISCGNLREVSISGFLQTSSVWSPSTSHAW